MSIGSVKVRITLLLDALTCSWGGVSFDGHVEVNGSGQESDQHTTHQKTTMKESSQLTAVPPEEAEVEERREDKRKNARGETADQCKTEFKARDADGHAPRH